jgi:propanediol utilization protein
MSAETRQRVEAAVKAVVDRLVLINVSARHMHIRQEHLEVLFGPGSRLTKLRDLYQPGEFASNETVTVVGPNRRVFEKVRILGPTRSMTQVELSYNDGRYIGMELPARISGDIKETAPITLVGPHGALHLEEGAIRALRHVHMSPEDASRLGLAKGQKVIVKTVGPMSVSFNNTVVRTGQGLKLEMHIDTDEANAAGLGSGTLGLLI